MTSEAPSILELAYACAHTSSETAWKDFVRRTQPVLANAIWQTISRRAGHLRANRSLVDDLVQQNFLKLLSNDRRALKCFEGESEGSFWAYIRVIATNVALDHLRRDREIACLDETIPDLRLPRMEDSLLMDSIEKHIETCTRGKSPRSKEIFNLYFKSGFSAEAIASIPSFDLKPSGVESLILRLTRCIRKIVAEAIHREGKHSVSSSRREDHRVEPVDNQHLGPSDFHLLVELRAKEEAGMYPRAEELRLHISECADCADILTSYEAAEETLIGVRTQSRAADPASEFECLSIERIVALSTQAGGSEEDFRHVSQCALCSERLLSALGDEGISHPALPSSISPRQWEMIVRPTTRLRASGRWWGVAAALIISISLGAIYFMNRKPGLDRLLATAYSARRPFEFRLPDAGYSTVAEQRGGGVDLFAIPGSLLEARGRIDARLKADSNNADALRAEMIATILGGDPERALAGLLSLRSRFPSEERLLVPLACAFFLRGGRQSQSSDGSSEDYAQALDWLMQIRNQKDPLVIFNRALVLEKIPNDEAAILAWKEYLQVDGTSGYAEEGRKHLEILVRKKTARNRVFEAYGAGPDRFLQLVSMPSLPKEFPADLFLDTALSQWLPGAGEGSPGRTASAIAAHDYRLRTGDPFLEEMVNSPQPAFALLGRAMLLNRSGNPVEGARLSGQAILELQGSGPQASILRARVEHVYALHRSSEARACLAEGRALRKDLAATSYFWMQSQNGIEIAICQSYLAKVSDAIESAKQALNIAVEHHLQSQEMRARSMVGDLMSQIGDSASLWREASTQLAIYWANPYPGNYAQQFFHDLRDAATEKHLPRAAYQFAASAATAISATPEVILSAFAWDNAADLAEECGFHALAERHRALADAAFSKIPDSRLKGIYLANATLFRGAAQLRTAQNPGSALAQRLERIPEDDLVTDYAKSRRNELLAKVFWKSGDFARAERKAMDTIERAATLGNKSSRQLMSPGANDAVRVLAEIRVTRDRDPRAGLEIWRRLSGPSPAEDGKASLLQDEVYLTWANLAGGVGLWVLDGEKLTFNRLPFTAERIAELSYNLAKKCSSPKSDLGAIERDRAELLEILASPIKDVLRSERTMIVDSDAALSAIPFSVLFADHPGALVRSFSFREYLERRNSLTPRPESAMLLFSSPTVARDFASEYSAPLANDESAEVRSLFRKVIHRTGLDANPVALQQDAPQAEVFHFVGHGTANAGNGALILSPAEPSRPYSGIVSAADVASQKWSRCQLAVLAACSTGPGSGSAALGDRSLVAAFLRAGARRVVASQWNVDGAATNPLMGAFYNAMLNGLEPALALQRGSQEIRRRPETRHPYYWAAFQIFGFR